MKAKTKSSNPSALQNKALWSSLDDRNSEQLQGGSREYTGPTAVKWWDRDSCLPPGT